MCRLSLPRQLGEPKPAGLPFPRRAKPEALGCCRVWQGQYWLFGQEHYKTGCFSAVFFCWLDSKFKFINPVSLWLLNQRGFESSSAHRHKSCLCSQSWVIIFEELNQELKSIGFSALKIAWANGLVFSVEKSQQLSNLCGHFCIWNMVSCC